MELNLSSIIKNEGSEKSFCENVKIEPIKYMGLEVAFNEDVNVCGSVKNVSGVLQLACDVNTQIFTNCARCLCDVKKEFSIRIEETLMQEGETSAKVNSKDDGEIIIFSGNTLLLDEIVLNNILVNMEVKYLCSPDCKGLCSVCGKNLNTQKCDCITDFIDPRLEVLSKLCDK